MFLSTCHHRHTHAVAVEREKRITLCHEDRFVATVGNEGVLAVGLTDEDTFHHLPLSVQAVLVLADFLQVVVPCHVFQHVNDYHLHRMLHDIKRLEYLLVGIGLVGMLREECLQHFSQLPFIEAFAFVLSFCHNIIVSSL